MRQCSGRPSHAGKRSSPWNRLRLSVRRTGAQPHRAGQHLGRLPRSALVADRPTTGGLWSGCVVEPQPHPAAGTSVAGDGPAERTADEPTPQQHRTARPLKRSDRHRCQSGPTAGGTASAAGAALTPPGSGAEQP